MNRNLSMTEYGNLITAEPTFSGREGNLYRKQNSLYKLYHNPYKYSYQRLKEIMSYQKWLQYTTLPLGSIHFLNQFMGAILKDYIDSNPLSILKTCSLEFRIDKLNELIRNLQELHSVGLTLYDFDIDNALITKEGTLELIDLDGDNIGLFHHTSELKSLLIQVRSTILECCFESFDSKEAITFLSKQDEQLSYPMLQELLEYIKVEQLDKNKCLLYNRNGEQYETISIPKYCM